MQEILNSFTLAAVVIFLFMTFMFFLAVFLKDNSIADIAWGTGFIITSIAVLIYNSSFGILNITATLCVVIWGIRLAVRIFLRNKGTGEDWRYKKWREEWGSFFYLRSYLQVFILQGLIMLINVSPLIIINSSTADNIGLFAVAGLSIWCLGFFFEAVGDAQLDRFIKNPAKKSAILDTGLWKYTRHPNYFGEVTMWWGLFVIALSVPFGWMAIAGPAIINLMIYFVSGVPMTERAMENMPGFREYRERTNALIPWFPKK
jgi:steroid 5-alpha reductase family enzyme